MIDKPPPPAHISGAAVAELLAATSQDLASTIQPVSRCQRRDIGFSAVWKAVYLLCVERTVTEAQHVEGRYLLLRGDGDTGVDIFCLTRS